MSNIKPTLPQSKECVLGRRLPPNMNVVVQRRFPVSLLLTSREQEEEQIDDWVEPEPIIKDAILLPGRKESQALLTPAGDGTDCSVKDGLLSARPCGLCLSKASCYTCPRCNMAYCGLACYKSPMHSACSEEFYKDCVYQELNCQGITGKEEMKKKMQEILLRLRDGTDIQGVIDSSPKDLMEETGESLTGQEAQVLGLLSRLAEIQENGEEKHEEIETILQKLKQIEEGIDGSNEDEVEDLAEKLSGHNIDTLTEEELWSMLPSQDKMMFQELVKGGGIGGLVPQWIPWWQRHDQNIKVPIEELKSSEINEQMTKKKATKMTDKNGIDILKNERENETGSAIQSMEINISKHAHITTQSWSRQGHEKHKMLKVMEKNIGRYATQSSAPTINDRIPQLNAICSSPSPLLQFSLVNILYGYSYCLCLFNGDILESEQLQEFCHGVVTISGCLCSGQVCCSLPEALDAGIMATACEYFDQEDPDAPTRAVKAVAHILTGESREDPANYTLAALTELGSAFRKAKVFIHKEEEQRRHKYFIARKKCEFLQSWVKENSDIVRSLAALAWSEYSRRWNERVTLQKEKKELEKVRWHITGRGKNLIKEIE